MHVLQLWLRAASMRARASLPIPVVIVPIVSGTKVAKAFGASEVCITAHHEGGFALWPSNHSGCCTTLSPILMDDGRRVGQS